MATSDAGRDRLSITLAIFGMYVFVAQPNANGTNKPAERTITILGNGIENSLLSSI